MMDEYRSTIGNLAATHPMLRLALHHHRVHNGTKEGGPLSFREMPFLVEIYRDLPKIEEMVAQKCTQVGWTESQLVFAVNQAGLRGRRWAYVLPHDGLLSTFVQERIQPLFDRVEFYRQIARAGWREKQADNMRLRQVGNGSWRWVGSRNAANFREWMADAVTVDEVDDCDQSNLPLVRDRLRSAENPQLFWLGNPKRPTGGIAKMFEASDQRRWYHRCTRCGYRQRIDWFRNVVEQTDGGMWRPRDLDRWRGLMGTKITDPSPDQDIRPVCQRCGRPWARTPEGAAWVLENPDHPRRGYHIAQMDHLGRSLWQMFTEFVAAQDDPDALVIWYGSVLGLRYVASGSQLTEQDLRGCLRDYKMTYNPNTAELYPQTIVAGIDVGAVINMSISAVERRPVDPSDEASDTYVVRKALWIGAVPTFDEVRAKLRDYAVDTAVIDAGPDIHGVRDLRDSCNGRTSTWVWACYYHPTPKVGKLPFGMTMDAGASVVTVDKTAVMDVTFAEIRQGRREYPSDASLVLHWSEQMRAPVRTHDEGGNRYVWVRGNKRDDYRQAECYERIALEVQGMAGGYMEIDFS